MQCIRESDTFYLYTLAVVMFIFIHVYVIKQGKWENMRYCLRNKISHNVGVFLFKPYVSTWVLLGNDELSYCTYI